MAAEVGASQGGRNPARTCEQSMGGADWRGPDDVGARSLSSAAAGQSLHESEHGSSVRQEQVGMAWMMRAGQTWLHEHEFGEHWHVIVVLLDRESVCPSLFMLEHKLFPVTYFVLGW